MFKNLLFPVLSMGKVAVSMKVTVKEGSDLRKITGEIRKIAGIKEAKEEDIGFGIKVLRVLALIDDSRGGSQHIEEMITGIKGVDTVDVEETTLI